MICIEAYRSAVGLWQNSSGKKQNQTVVKENRGGDSFGNLGSHLNEKRRRGDFKGHTFNTYFRICILLITTTVLISSLSENGDMSFLRKHIQILLL